MKQWTVLNRQNHGCTALDHAMTK